MNSGENDQTKQGDYQVENQIDSTEKPREKQNVEEHGQNYTVTDEEYDNRNRDRNEADHDSVAIDMPPPVSYYQDPYVTQSDSNQCCDCDEDSCEGFFSCLRLICCINALSNITGHDLCTCDIYSCFCECLDDCFKCICNCECGNCGDCNCDDCNCDDCDCDCSD